MFYLSTTRITHIMLRDKKMIIKIIAINNVPLASHKSV